MSYFCGLSVDEVKGLTGMPDDQFNHSLAALRFARIANGVSQLHGEVSRLMWRKYSGICPILSITNAQSWRYWADKHLYRFREEGNDEAFDDRKKHLKRRAFDIVADQTGKLFDPAIFTIVWARRFAGYKRAGMIARDRPRFEALLNNTKYPVQIIWAGKPYPLDYPAISEFNELVHISKRYKNVAVLIGYELGLSKRLKQAIYEILQTEILPLYYEDFSTWRQIVKNGMRDVQFQFDSMRMASEYYKLLYNEQYNIEESY
jgi:starch phosphorylase